MEANRVPLTPLSFLNRSADVFPEATAVVRGDGSTVTYAQLRRRARRLAEQLSRSGVERGDRVAVLAPNDLPLLESHYGIPSSGAVLVALNTRLAPREYEGILHHCGARLLIVDEAYADLVAPVRSRLPDLDQVVVVPHGDEAASTSAGYEEWLAESAGDGPLALPTDEDAAIALNYTSGTTGSPKGAVYTHRGAYLNALGQALEMGFDARTVYLWTLPMFHCNGWCHTWAVAAVGGRNVCLRHFEPDVALELMVDHGVTHFCGAPVVLNALAGASEGRDRLRRQVTAATGGAPPSPAVISAMSRLGIDVVHLYGLTETYGPSVVCEPQERWASLGADDLAVAMSRQGVRTVNVEAVRVVDEDRQDVPRDGQTMGEIVVRSNTVMRGYFRDESETAHALREGWFHTGDLAVHHEDGYIEVRDRSKDIIISGGENVSSIEVENVLASHPHVSEVAVVARPDARWGEVPVAFVTLRPDGSATERELIEWVRQRIARFKAPKAVIFQELPKTSTGKIRKSDLREIAADAEGGRRGSPEPQD